MKSTESAPAAASTHTYAAPTPNPFIIVSDRSSRLTLIVLVSCALTVALTACSWYSPATRRLATRRSTLPMLFGVDWRCSLPA